MKKLMLLLFFYCPFLTLSNNLPAVNPSSSSLSEMACTADYEEKNGLVVMEAENLSYSSSWRSRNTVSGYTGSGYLVWEGSDYFHSPGNGLITTKIQINKTGTYKFQWRSKVGKGTQSTEHNDTWIRFPDADNFYAQRGTSVLYPAGSGKSPTPDGAGSGGWFKAYLSGTTNWTWSTLTNDGSGYEIYVTFNSPGEYTMEISARSSYHLIDRIILHNGASSPTSLSNPETKCSSSSVAVTGVSLSPSSISLSEGANQQLSMTISPSNATNKNVSWSTGNSAVATVSSTGKVFAQNAGTTVITVTTQDGGFKDSSTVTVTGGTTTSQSVSSFTLYNASTDQPIMDITEGMKIDYSQIQGLALTIVANTNPATVGSVSMVLSGDRSKSQVDNEAPYALYGSSGSNFSGPAFYPGSYTISATPYSGANVSGSKGTGLTVNFSIEEGTTAPQQSVSSFTLYNASTDQPIMDITEGMKIDYSQIQGLALTIVANTNPGTVGSVSMVLSGDRNKSQVDNEAPYALYGSSGSNFSGPAFYPGSYTISATPYSVADAGGTKGTGLTVNFSIEEGTTAPQQSVSSFTLYNASTDLPIMDITEGMKIDYSQIQGLALTIVANTNPGTVGSVSMVLSGDRNKSQVDNEAPYALYGSSGSNFSGPAFYPGSYTISATPYSGADAGGTKGTGLTVNFSIEEGTAAPQQSITSFTLYNAGTDQPLMSLYNGLKINYSQIQGLALTIVANTNPATVGSVSMALSGDRSKSQVDNEAPYALYGSAGGNFSGPAFYPGSYTISATPYSGADASGTKGSTLSISFEIVDGSSVKAISAKSSISENSTETSVKVYPNPVRDGRFTINIPGLTGDKLSYALFNSLGMNVSGGDISLERNGTEIEFDLSGVMTVRGVYFLMLKGNGMAKPEKVTLINQ